MSCRSTNFVLQHTCNLLRDLLRTTSWSSTNYHTRAQTRSCWSTTFVIGHIKYVLGHEISRYSTNFSCSSRKYKLLTPLVHHSKVRRDDDVSSTGASYKCRCSVNCFLTIVHDKHSCRRVPVKRNTKLSRLHFVTYNLEVKHLLVCFQI